METCLVNALVDAVDKGKRAENGFTKEAWTAVYDALCEEFSAINFTMMAIKSREAKIKKGFWEFQNCRDNSGFGWDDKKQIPTAPDTVWEEYIGVILYFF
jgi:hypothetical protein